MFSINLAENIVQLVSLERLIEMNSKIIIFAMIMAFVVSANAIVGSGCWEGYFYTSCRAAGFIVFGESE